MSAAGGATRAGHVVAMAIVCVAGCGRVAFGTDGGTSGDSNTDTASGMQGDAPYRVPAFIENVTVDCMPASSCIGALTHPQAGHVVLVTFTYMDAGANVVSVNDAAGNVYTRQIGPLAWPSSPFWTELWASTIATEQVGLQIDVTFGETHAFVSVYLDDYQANAIDQVASASDPSSGPAIATGLEMTTDAPEIIFGHGESQGGLVGGGTGFTVRSTHLGNLEEDKPAAAAGSYDVELVLDSPHEWIAVMATLR